MRAAGRSTQAREGEYTEDGEEYYYDEEDMEEEYESS